MKKLLLKFVVFVVLFFVIDRGVGLAFYLLDTKLLEYPIEYQTAYNKTMHGFDEDIVIIGDSRARHHYIPSAIEDSLGMSVINAGRDGGAMVVEAILIDGMLRNDTTPPKYILWEKKANMFSSQYYLSEELERMNALNLFYDGDSLSHSYINQRSKYEKYKMLSHSYRNNGRLLGLLEVFAMGQKYSDLKGYWPVKAKTKQPIIKNKHYDCHYDKSREDLFIKVVNDAKRKHCKLIMTISPQFENSNITDTYEAQRFYKITDSLDVPVLDFYSDSLFLSNPSYFNEASHLNEIGVNKYMTLFIPALKAQMLKDSIINYE